MLASEATPLSKTGGLADVAAALSQYLHRQGHDVRLFTPLYGSIAPAFVPAGAAPELSGVPLAVGPHRYLYSVRETTLPGSDAPVCLIDIPALFHRPTLYTSDPDEHLRFLAFTRAVFDVCRRRAWAPDILHCNDWHTAFAPLFLKAQYQSEALFARTRSVLTIHNIGYQGIFPAAAVADLALGSQAGLLHQDELRAGRINPLRHGILYANAITTVSPTHAREICSDEYGMGLQDSLRSRRDVLTGILNGVDYSVWDPRIDRYLPQHFDASRLPVKRELKRELLQRLGLTLPAEAALGGIVSRFAAQKGIDLMFEALPELLAWRNFGFVALGSGEEPYERFFARLQDEFPGRVLFTRGYDDELAHWIEAACDFFVMPSLYEPCGLNQMYSLRYGTVPVVRRTGGLADSVEHYDPTTGSGTGVVFNHFDREGLEWGLNTVLDLYDAPTHWERLQRNGMRRDFSWDRQGKLYVDIYEAVCA